MKSSWNSILTMSIFLLILSCSTKLRVLGRDSNTTTTGDQSAIGNGDGVPTTTDHDYEANDTYHSCAHTSAKIVQCGKVNEVSTVSVRFDSACYYHVYVDYGTTTTDGPPSGGGESYSIQGDASRTCSQSIHDPIEPTMKEHTFDHTYTVAGTYNITMNLLCTNDYEPIDPNWITLQRQLRAPPLATLQITHDNCKEMKNHDPSSGSSSDGGIFVSRWMTILLPSVLTTIIVCC